jgi:hypothetical protein
MRLRETLGEKSVEPSSKPIDPATGPQGIAESTIAADSQAERREVPAHSLNERFSIANDLAEASLFDASMASDNASIDSRPAIFNAWQDDQIRRHFGPMGIDTIIDLLRAPLARRHDPDRSEMPLVLLGRGAWDWAANLAEGLIQNGTPPFAIYVCDPDARRVETAAGFGHDRPVDAFLRDLPCPRDPARLRASLEEINPVALISRNFLSAQSDVDPWLDVFASVSTAGTCLLFSERTGVGRVAAPPELSSIGDRIWELMPDRYTRIERNAGSTDAAHESARITSWRDAFELSQRAGENMPTNDLLAKLRNRFRLEMLAKFGFLAESFVATPIGQNFDASATRDRKFLNQIADVDDRKIEAGVVPALHLVAVVDHDPDSTTDPEAMAEIAPQTQR